MSNKSNNGIRRGMSTEKVQHWVLTLLILAVSAFPTGAMIAAVLWLDDEGRHGDGTLINVMIGVLGLICCIAIRLVHRTTVLSWVLLLGFVPAAVVAIFLR